jgi:hypothetical protein
MTDLIQMKLSLPPELAAYVQDQAARSDRTPSGQVRHWISELRRREPPPERTGVSNEFAPPVPAVKPDAQSIIEAKERLASLKAEREEILRRKRLWQTTVNEDTRVDRIVAEVEVLGKRIAAAEKMLPRNGGRHG